MSATATRLGPSTPITATPSSLATRAAPALPPSTQTYEPLVKAVLTRRLARHVFISSAASSWMLTAFWTSWQRGGIEAIGLLGWLTNWFAFSTILCAALFWVLGAVPIIIVRKRQISVAATGSASLSPKQTFTTNASQPRYRSALTMLLISSVALTLSHSFASYIVETSGRGDGKLGIWVGSKKHPYHLNGRLIFMLVAQMSGAIVFWLRDVLRDRFNVRWARYMNLSAQIPPALVFSVVPVLLLSVLSTTVAVITFAVGRMFVLPLLYRIPVLHGLLRPFVAHFLRPKFTATFLLTHFGVIIRAYFLVTSSTLIWETTSTVFDVCASVPVTVTEGLKEPALLLASGISSTDPYFQLHAFNELCALSSDSSEAKAKRALIYENTKHKATLWSVVVRRCLILLGNDYQLFLRRGAPAPAPSPAPPPPIPKPIETPTTPLLRTPIYKTAQQSPSAHLADTFSSDGALTKVLSQASGDAFGLSDVLKAVGSPSRFIPPVKVPELKAIAPGAAASSASVTSSILAVKELVLLNNRPIRAWWTRERKDRAAYKALPNRELDCMNVEVLGTLVAHSLTEDAYGIVQRDIPRVLEAMISFLSALEDYQVELNASVPVLSPEEEAQLGASQLAERLLLKSEVALAGEWINGLMSALRTSIHLVVRTFDDRLSSFKFPPKIASKIQAFVDYI